MRISDWSSDVCSSDLRELPLWRRKRPLFIEATLLVLGVIGVAYALLRESPAIAFAERDWVVVGDLSNHTSEPLFDNALDTALRIGLEQSRYVNVVPELRVEEIGRAHV